MSGDPAGAGEPAALAEIASRQANPEFMGRLFGGDAAAKAEWDGLYQRAHPEPSGPSYTVRDDGVNAPGFDAGDVPPNSTIYSFPPTLEPGLEPAFRAGSFAAGLGVREASALAAAYLEASQVVGSLRTDDDDQSLVDFTKARLGAADLDHARAGFRHLRAHAPGLAAKFEDDGTANHWRLGQALAAIGRRLR